MNVGENVVFLLTDHLGPFWVTGTWWGDVRTEGQLRPPAEFQYTHRNSSVVTGPFPLVHGHCETQRKCKDELCRYREVWHWLAAIASRKASSSSAYSMMDINDYIMKMKVVLKVPLENIDRWILLL